jgi:DNA ligase-1
MVLFGQVADLAESLANEGSKLKKRAAIADAAKSIARAASDMSDAHGSRREARGSDVTAAVVEAGRFCLYLAGQPFAEADARKLNAGGAILSRAVKEVSGATDAALTAAYRRHGDLGAAASDLWKESEQRGELTLEDVAAAFDVMSRARTTAVRFGAVEGMLRRATAVEAKYLLKLMLGDMRIGVKQSLVEEAIAVAAGAEVAAVRHAVMLEADLSRAVERAFAGTLSEARMRLFHPLGFMLASPVETPEEAMERFTAKPKRVKEAKAKGSRKKTAAAEELLAAGAADEGFAEDVEAEAVRGSGGSERRGVHALLEDKYDGIRAQVHCGDPEQPGRVAIYSRNREDVTVSFPELEEAFSKVNTGPSGLILDGEVLGWDVAAERAVPFSVLGQRIGRKRVEDAIRRTIPVVFMAFDLMFADGELMLTLPLGERRAWLEEIVRRLAPVTTSPLVKEKEQAGLFEEMMPTHRDGTAMNGTPGVVQRLRLSPVRMVESAEGIELAYREARERANEGVMIKAAGSAYLPGRRGLAWVKLKRELATLDVVITGAEYGHGRRAGLLSDYTFAVRGRLHGGESGDGTAELLNVGKAYSGVTDAEIAELTEWLKAHTIEDFGHFRTVEPLRVLEVAFNNIMRSDRHSSGFALRFPRILRVRDDKPVDEIDTLERVREVYESQPDKGV